MEQFRSTEICPQCQLAFHAPRYEREHATIIAHHRLWDSMTQLERTYFEEISSCMSKDLKRYEMVMERLMEVRSTLWNQKWGLEELQSRVQSLFRPIRNLPPELLERIFYHLPHYKDMLDAAAVCSRWRDVVLSSPRLWTRLSFNIKTWKGIRTSPRHMVSTLLQRSASLPLAVELVRLTNLPPDGWRRPQFLSLLNQCSGRLTHLSVDLDSCTRFSKFGIQAEFPVLQVLQISGGEDGDLLVFQRAHVLHTLVLKNIRAISTLPSSFQQIQCLSFRHCIMSKVTPIMNGYKPQVGSLEVQFLYCKETPDDHPSRIMSSATSLIFIHDVSLDLEEEYGTDSDGDFFDPESGRLEFFSRLHTPSLQSVTLSGFRPHFFGSQKMLVFISRCPTLQKLDIGNGRGMHNSKDITKLLRRASNVTSLSVFDNGHKRDACVVDKTFLRSLTIPQAPSDQIVLPRLQNIQLTLPRCWVDNPEERAAKDLVRMIASRLQAPATPDRDICLRTVHLSVARDAEADKYTDEYSYSEKVEAASLAKAYTVERAIGKAALARLVAMRKDDFKLITTLPPEKPSYHTMTVFDEDDVSEASD